MAAGLFLLPTFAAFSQSAKSMAVMETRYEVRMGEATEVPVQADTRDFIAHAKTRRVTIGGQDAPGFVVAPNEKQDKILLAPNSKAAPGEYTVTLSATSAEGEEMTAEVNVVVKPRVTVPKNSTRAPVVLLNGWIAGYNGANCTISSNSTVTFGNLAQYLIADGVPVVFLFDNCAEDPNQSIEQLGIDLGRFLNTIQYDDGTQVTQIDLVAHSIGGLIARAYLEGLQTSQSYLPPYSPLVRSLVLIATPNFGSFVVGGFTLGILPGTQTFELIPGSAMLWNLATWNQRGDDLAGVNAIAIVGNAGPYFTSASTTQLLNASDGLVSTTSAALGFVTGNANATQTRIVPYCHVDPVVFTNTQFGTFNCNAIGIANVTSTSHLTGQIVRSYLSGTNDWKSVGTGPSDDTFLSTDGGEFFALQNVKAGYANDLTTVSWGTVPLTNGGNTGTIYYTDFVKGTGNFTAASSSLGTYNCGSLALPSGGFTSFRCKLNLAISCPPAATSCQGAVTPLNSTATGRTVTSGTTITLTGTAFGTQCSNCQVYATPAGSSTTTPLTVTAWSNTSISVQLPSSLTGYQTLQVNAVGGVDAIGVRAVAASASPALSLDTTSLAFAYTAGGSLPTSQAFNITNSGTGSLTWSASVNSAATWLILDSMSGTAPTTVNVSVNPALLTTAGTYTGTITISGTGASNSPATVSVTLVVSAAAASMVVSPDSLSFTYVAGGAVPAPQNLLINNGGGGTFNWVASSSDYWVSLSPASGSLPGTLTVSVIPQNVAPGTNNATITIAASDGSVNPMKVAVTLTVTGTPPTPVIEGISNAAVKLTNFASATWVSIFGTNLSQLAAPYIWQASDFVNGALPTSLHGVSVSINGIPAYIDYISPTQINVLAPDDAATGSVPVVVTVAGQPSVAFNVTKNPFSPAFLMFDTTHVAAEHLDYSLLGPPGVLPGATFTPAAAGETVILYGVGFGPTSPAAPTGQIVPGGETLVNTVTMAIGGVPVTPSFAGLSSSGLYQFNVQVPASLTTGDAVVTATIGGVTTQTGVVLTVK